MLLQNAPRARLTSAMKYLCVCVCVCVCVVVVVVVVVMFILWL